MKKYITGIIICGLLGATPALAGSGHEHKHTGEHGHSHGPISKEKAAIKAEKYLARLIKKGKIDKSWADKKASNVESKMFNGKKEWVVVFKNPELSDKSKQTLYMFFKIDGHYLATNYTGK